MTLTRSKRKLSGILLLVVMFIAIGLIASGCVQGLTPIGWSGGTVSGDTLYIGSIEGRVVMVNLKDESYQQSEPLRTTTQQGLFGCGMAAMGGGCGGAAGVAIYGTPVVSGEFVYVAGYNGIIYAYSTDSLAERWRYPRDGNLEPYVGGIVVDDERLYIGSSDGMVYALDATNGDFLWNSSPTDDKIWATPAVDEDTVYIGSFDEKFYALNAADGTVKWEFPAEGSIITKPLIYNGIVYFGSMDKNFYAVDTASGNLKWKYTGENWFWASPVIHEGYIYAGCLDNMVYILDADTGNKVNEYDLGSPVSSSPVIVDNSVIFASRGGVIYVIDSVSGGIKTIAELEKKDINGPLTGHNDIVYVHPQDTKDRDNDKILRFNVVNGSELRSIDLKR